MASAELDKICDYNGELISLAREGWLDEQLRAEAAEKNIAIEEIDQWIRKQLSTLSDHLKFCERCQATRTSIESEGSVFDGTRADPRIFPDAPASND
ncbi:MAG TPA: hypothetical protein VHA78_00610 [Candidatus Peribacteraceae bacterium]|nr:hypothetical protein [Candidatus Peribacteraceae bacterium]